MTTKRKGKRNRVFLGTRNHGKGNAKNRRGKGNKGGWGRSGMHKHRFSYITTYERHWMSNGNRFGFDPKNSPLELPVVNLYELEQMVRSGEIAKKGALPYFEFEGKILGTGAIHSAVHVKAKAGSEKAMERIKKAGGQFELFEAETEEAPAPKAPAKPEGKAPAKPAKKQ